MQDQESTLKIRVPSGLLTVVILTVLSVAAAWFVPSVPVRVILGLPLLLFFPGYALLSALFVDDHGMDGLERLAVSSALSIAIVALIGFLLNYTAWGIRLNPVLSATAAFVLVASAVGLARRFFSSHRDRLVVAMDLPLPRWQVGGPGQYVTLVLIISIVIALGALGYVSTAPTARGPFTEFYLLGLDGKAQDYPAEFALESGQVTGVTYGDGRDSVGQWGVVIIGITNHEGLDSTYAVSLRIDGQPAPFSYAGEVVDRVEGIELGQGEKWEQQIGFAPQRAGDNQKVEFLLFKGDDAAAQDSLVLWVNAGGGT